MPGIQTPFIYIGMVLSMFGFHIEDGNLPSILFLYDGRPKIWYAFVLFPFHHSFLYHKLFLNRYFVPFEENKKFEALLKKISEKINCPLYIRHKSLLIPPSVLAKHGIKFTRVWIKNLKCQIQNIQFIYYHLYFIQIIQYPGEFVISLSGGYHAGFNTGLNISESVNFGSQRWVENFHSFKPCECEYVAYIIIFFSHHQLF